MKVKLSSSKMDYYRWCNRKYRIRHIENIVIPFVSPEMKLGSVLHKEINIFWSDYRLDLDTFIEDINAYYDRTVKKVINSLDNNSYIKFQIYFSNFCNFQIRRIQTYLEKYNDYQTIKSYFYPMLSEKYYRTDITSDVQFGFIIDALFKGDYGNILIDWKSGKKCSESEFKKMKPQLNRYTSGLSRMGKSNEFVGIYFLKDSLYFQSKKTIGYSLEDEVLSFIRELQVSKFPKVKKNENYKCSARTYQCEYYPEVCSGCMV